MNLPVSKDVEAYFGVHAETGLGVRRYLARTLMVYDVLNNYVLDRQISTMENGEKTLLKASLSKISDNDILILDRGLGISAQLKS